MSGQAGSRSTSRGSGDKVGESSGWGGGATVWEQADIIAAISVRLTGGRILRLAKLPFIHAAITPDAPIKINGCSNRRTWA